MPRPQRDDWPLITTGEAGEDETREVVRKYGGAFEQLASEASPVLAMAWLQPVLNEYKNRGVNVDAARVQAASAEKEKGVASDFKEIRTSLKITPEQMHEFVNAITKGATREALLRITSYFIPEGRED